MLLLGKLGGRDPKLEGTNTNDDSNIFSLEGGRDPKLEGTNTFGMDNVKRMSGRDPKLEGTNTANAAS